MSKLKTAKAIQKSFAVTGKIIKWLAIGIGVTGVSMGLTAWSGAHFLSFAIVMGIVLALGLFVGSMCLLDWSDKVIEDAEEEEKKAQERNRMEKERKENPGKYVPSFDGYDHSSDRW